MTKHRSSALDLTTSIALASMHSGITLWHRLPMLAAPPDAGGKSRHAGELDRMMREKASAAIEGAFEAQKELFRLAGAAMTGRLDFTAMPDVLATVAAAGLRPAFRTVEANSRRLGRRR